MRRGHLALTLLGGVGGQGRWKKGNFITLRFSDLGFSRREVRSLCLDTARGCGRGSRGEGRIKKEEKKASLWVLG